MAAQAAYVAPAVEVLEVSVERGFATSDEGNGLGDLGGDVTLN
jgi:hypothetical protein